MENTEPSPVTMEDMINNYTNLSKIQKGLLSLIALKPYPDEITFDELLEIGDRIQFKMKESGLEIKDKNYFAKELEYMKEIALEKYPNGAFSKESISNICIRTRTMIMARKLLDAWNERSNRTVTNEVNLKVQNIINSFAQASNL